MTLAIFDLDQTLLDDDSERMWSTFLYQQAVVGEDFIAQIARYYQDYENGRLDLFAYEAFLLHPLLIFPQEKMLALRQRYLELVRARIRPALIARVAGHRAQGHELLLITATNQFLAEPIAEMLGFANLICTQIETLNGSFTGKLTGVPAFRDGKITRLNHWLEGHQQTLGGSWGYSDSYNDLPLLDSVHHPVVVTPDPRLRQHAIANCWEIIDAAVI